MACAQVGALRLHEDAAQLRAGGGRDAGDSCRRGKLEEKVGRELLPVGGDRDGAHADLSARGLACGMRRHGAVQLASPIVHSTAHEDARDTRAADILGAVGQPETVDADGRAAGRWSTRGCELAQDGAWMHVELDAIGGVLLTVGAHLEA